MKQIFYFILSLSFFSPVLAATMDEKGKDIGHGDVTQKINPIPSKTDLDRVKQTVQEYEEAQQKRMATAAQTMDSPINDSENFDSMSAIPLDGPRNHFKAHSEQAVEDSNLEFTESAETDELRSLGEKSLRERLRDEGIYQDIKPVDYKTSTQVFYKKKCSSVQKNCDRGPLLTNIKSVIFDYAHNRGSFSQSQKAKNK